MSETKRCTICGCALDDLGCLGLLDGSHQVKELEHLRESHAALVAKLRELAAEWRREAEKAYRIDEKELLGDAAERIAALLESEADDER